ncbi:MAG: neuromedin U [bacterium]|nr:neuromedin U [bacterium]
MFSRRALQYLFGVAAVLGSFADQPSSAQQRNSAATKAFDFSALTIPQHVAQHNESIAPAEQDMNAAGNHSSASSAEGTENLAKEAQNPIASMISFPIQWNATPATQWAPSLIDPKAKRNRTQNIVNIQPVVPFSVSKDLTIVTRTIVPFVNQPWANGTDINGLGDINPSVFFVPTLKGDLTIGLGPTMVIPSATDIRLSSQRWSAGPSAVMVYSKGPWVLGGLANNIWSFAGSSGRDVNKLLVQPFINYNMPKGWYLTSSPVITSNWNAKDNEGWTVPLGIGIGRVFKIGSQPVNASLSGYWNIVKPKILGEELMGDFTIRTQIQFLFPTSG